ncbi:hypothetical protein FGO68_gene7346 [Halteria grandinella]|uniref:Uncharacterized protein n=1 Tax=Halteria grandinella TaxID=5974 RepID=A0A8J8SZD3_HALGN|nr:hypothetical protein FGO68_gene7346 [Halteria grandinella]
MRSQESVREMYQSSEQKAYLHQYCYRGGRETEESISFAHIIALLSLGLSLINHCFVHILHEFSDFDQLRLHVIHIFLEEVHFNLDVSLEVMEVLLKIVEALGESKLGGLERKTKFMLKGRCCSGVGSPGLFVASSGDLLGDGWSTALVGRGLNHLICRGIGRLLGSGLDVFVVRGLAILFLCPRQIQMYQQVCNR